MLIVEWFDLCYLTMCSIYSRCKYQCFVTDWMQTSGSSTAPCMCDAMLNLSVSLVYYTDAYYNSDLYLMSKLQFFQFALNRIESLCESLHYYTVVCCSIAWVDSPHSIITQRYNDYNRPVSVFSNMLPVSYLFICCLFVIIIKLNVCVQYLIYIINR